MDDIQDLIAKECAAAGINCLRNVNGDARLYRCNRRPARQLPKLRAVANGGSLLPGPRACLGAAERYRRWLPAAPANESVAEIHARPTLGGEPLHGRDGVIRFQHRRKISSILIRNTVVPIAIHTTSGSCLAIEGVKSTKTRSCYEYHPPGCSKTMRAAVGRSIFAADGIGRTSKPAAGEGEPADRRA
jgi:hypothetical protein